MTSANAVSGFVAAALALSSAAALANDSAAQIGVGGLALIRNDSVRLDSEDLTIARQRVTVAYRFTNGSTQDVETLVAFPLPDQTFDVEAPVVDFADKLDFRTTVDGAPVKYDIVLRATLAGQDITQRLASLGLPILPAHDAFDKVVNALPEATRETLAAEGLIADDGSDGVQRLWVGKWTVATAVTRRQIFPAGRSIRVEHSYVPYVGGSVGGYLDPQYRSDEDFAARRNRYCIDDAFLAGLDRRMAEGKRRAAGFRYGEVWLTYLLSPGANWAGPIRDFHLIVDKGDPQALVSFCGQGVKRLDATRFEMRATDFTPKRDLDVLIVDFYDE
jgi:hypothetical protein